ncbi:MAG: ATP-dependent DNA helicase RecG [Pseudomonadota bacterium]
MGTRPPKLYPLFAELTGLAGVGPKTGKLFEALGVTKPRDLIFTLPSGGTDRRLRDGFVGVPLPATVTLRATIGQHHPPRSRTRPYRISAHDGHSHFQIVYFHANGEWLARHLPEGAVRVISGKMEVFDSIAQMVHPDHVLREEDAQNLPPFEASYPLTAGLTQKTVTKAMGDALTRLPDMPEWIDPSVRAAQGWPVWSEAVVQAHAPHSARDLSVDAPARTRLAYDEVLSHQLTLALARAQQKRAKGRITQGDGRLRDQVLRALGFDPTGAQTRAIAEITQDMGDGARMNRLLQGDVGSGKTLVALMAMLCAVEAGGQAALMVPTEILARQHMESLAPLVEPLGLDIGLITGRDTGAERADKREALRTGQLQLAIGTHALFQKGVEFADLRLAVVDEQHRFGVRQRMDLSAKGDGVDVLVMTATPIPRSLALSQYGDMDVSVLDEKPPGRKPVETVLVSAGRLDQVVARLQNAVAEGRQAYWVCPLVEESEVTEATAAEDRFRALRISLGEGVVDLVHGQMPPAQKDAAMARFVQGDARVLVATTVIEVGVNVPNATIMVIEQAERFGLAQLHQLRGRVGRGAAQSTCLMLYDPPLGETAKARLGILRETEDGFRIAEEDLRLRGAGDVLGLAQSGLPRFQIADLERQAHLMALAQDDARLHLTRDPDLTTERGEALRLLLYLMERDQSVGLLRVG